MKTVEHELDGVWVDDWLEYICNLKPTQQSFFYQAHGSSTLLLHSSWSNVLYTEFIIQGEMKFNEEDADTVSKSFKVVNCHSTVP